MTAYTFICALLILMITLDAIFDEISQQTNELFICINFIIKAQYNFKCGPHWPYWNGSHVSDPFLRLI